MKLTEIDFKTVLTVDSSYILNKCAELYIEVNIKKH